MNDALNSFPWPMPPGTATPPHWAGSAFAVDGETRAVLSYDADDSHWSAELTKLHEAEAGSTHPIDLASRRLAVQFLREHLPDREGGTPIVLDVGCSSGFVLEEIRRILPAAALVGSDYLLAPLEGLAARMPGLPILQFDLRRCPLPDACVDAVTALNVLEHIDDDAGALREIARILRPGGIAHVEVPAGPALFDVYDEQLMHHRRYRLSELLGKARAAGFEVLRGTHLGFFLYAPFAWVKRRNRQLLTLPEAEKRALVADQIRRTGNSRVLDYALRLEEALGWLVRYPVGIRCLAGLKKPA